MPTLVSVLAPPVQSTQDAVDVARRELQRLERRRVELVAEKAEVEAEVRAKNLRLAEASVDGALQIDHPGTPKQQLRILAAHATIDELDARRLPRQREILAAAEADHDRAVQIGVDRQLEDDVVALQDGLAEVFERVASFMASRDRHSGGLAIPCDLDIAPMTALCAEMASHLATIDGGRTCRSNADLDRLAVASYRDRQNGEGRDADV